MGPGPYDRTQQLRRCRRDCPVYLGALCDKTDHEEMCNGTTHRTICKNLGPCNLADKLWEEVRKCDQSCTLYNLSREEEIFENLDLE